MLLQASNSDIGAIVESFDKQVAALKEEFYKISWYMRGGVQIDQLYYSMSQEDRAICHRIIADNIDTTKKSGLPLL